MTRTRTPSRAGALATLLLGPVTGVTVSNAAAVVVALLVLGALRRHVDWRGFRRLAPLIVLGSIGGALAVRSTPKSWLDILVGGSVTGMFLHILVILPILFFACTRENPYTFWFKCSRAWITAWGTASSAATLPVTIRCLQERKVPVTVAKFTAPLGCLINMDG